MTEEQAKASVIALGSEEIAALARVYMRWESRRPRLTRRAVKAELAANVCKVDHAERAVEKLLERSFIRYSADSPINLEAREIEITKSGSDWFERNVDYWRDCNNYRYKSRCAQVGCFEVDPRKSLTARLRDPLVAMAAAGGAILALICSWWLG